MSQTHNPTPTNGVLTFNPTPTSGVNDTFNPTPTNGVNDTFNPTPTTFEVSDVSSNDDSIFDGSWSSDDTAVVVVVTLLVALMLFCFFYIAHRRKLRDRLANEQQQVDIDTTDDDVPYQSSNEQERLPLTRMAYNSSMTTQDVVEHRT